MPRIENKKFISIMIAIYLINAQLISFVVTSEYKVISQIMIILTCAMAIMEVVYDIRKNYQKSDMRAISVIIVVAFLIIVSAIKSDNLSVIPMIAILIASRNYEINDFVKLSLNITFLFSAFEIALWIINNYFSLGLNGYNGTAITFLKTHQNIAAIQFSSVIIEYAWLNWEKKGLTKYLVILAGTVFTISTTGADSPKVLYVLLMLMLIKNNKYISRVLIELSKYIFPILTFVTYFIAKNFMNPKYHDKLYYYDLEYTSRRFSMWYLGLYRNGLTFFGNTELNKFNRWSQIFNFNGFTLDGLYIECLTNVGILYLVLIGLGFIYLGNQKNYKVAVIIIVFSLYAFSEGHVLYIGNFFVLFLMKDAIFLQGNKELTNVNN